MVVASICVARPNESTPIEIVAPRSDVTTRVRLLSIAEGRASSRATAHGFEDFVAFDTKPAREEIVYAVDTRRADGVRFVGGVLELLDGRGAPRLHVLPPWVEGANGRREATIDVTGCNFDTSPRAPWGRPVTPPRSSTCELHVRWHDVAYPALVDPEWSTTGSMSIARTNPTLTLLDDGKMLVTNGAASKVAELYDPATGTFATTGSTAAATNAPAVLLANKKVLIARGTAAASELYDPVAGTFSNTGTAGQDFGVGGPILLASGKVLVIASSGSPSQLYDPGTGTYSNTGTMATSHPGGEASILASGKVLVTGTVFGGTAADIYDPGAGTFTPLAHTMVTGRGLHGSILLSNGKTLICGGRQSGTTLNQAELFDEAAGTFTATGSMSVPRESVRLAAIGNDRVVVFGGLGNGPGTSDVTELYDPASGTWALGATLAANSSLALARLDSGVVLGVGGSTASTTASLFVSLANGAKCSDEKQCDSGQCVDGVCCNARCEGQCEACDVAGSTGTCSPIKDGAPHGDRTACATAGNASCSGKCDGTARDHCAYPAAETKCATSCSNASTIDTTCDGTGACAAPLAPVPCAHGLACADATSCRTTCTMDTDCTSGFSCQPDGTCGNATICLDSHTSKPAKGASVDCTPFNCGTDGECKTHCASVSDCAPPAVCNSSGTCETPATGAGDGGCNQSGDAPTSSIFVAVGLAISALFGRAKNRERKKEPG